VQLTIYEPKSAIIEYLMEGLVFFFFSSFLDICMVGFISLITKTNMKYTLDVFLSRYPCTFISLTTGALLYVKINDFYVPVDETCIFTANLLGYGLSTSYHFRKILPI
jgi:hypothetical protein